MKTQTDSIHRKLDLGQITFLILLGCVLAANVQPLYGEVLKIYNSRKLISSNPIGYKFFGLEAYLGEETHVGYYTNEDMKMADPQETFAHAQYVLAPTILEFGNFNHRYIIFACSSQEEAFKKIYEIGAQPLIKNQYNIILAKRKDL